MLNSCSRRLLAACQAATVLVACAGANGPVGSPEFESILRASVPIEGEALLFYAPAGWAPDIHSFEDIIDDLIADRSQIFRGVVVITDRSLSLVRWDADVRKYIRSQYLPLSEVLSTRIEVDGRAKALVVQRRDLSVEFIAFSPGSRADEALEFLPRDLMTREGH